MAEERQHPLSRQDRIRAAAEAGTLAALPVDMLRDEVAWRASAGLMKAPKKGATKEDLIAALGGTAPAQETTTAPSKER